MKAALFVLSGLALAICSRGADDAFDRKNVEAVAAAALKKETEGDWKKIHWEKTPDEAVKKANTAKKPILIVLVVGERGQKNAAEC